MSDRPDIVDGRLEIDSGGDVNDDGRLQRRRRARAHDMAVPTSPFPNQTFSGHIHLAEGAVDRFKYVFNEQKVLADGSIMVLAGHQKMLGPFAVGNLFLSRAICGVS